MEGVAFELYLKESMKFQYQRCVKRQKLQATDESTNIGKSCLRGLQNRGY